MSIRYGISLILEPAFTAGLHRARQVICSQYGCWAAEMHSVHIPLTGYFPCQGAEVRAVDAGLVKVAEEFRSRNSQTLLARQGVVAEAGDRGSVHLDFGIAGDPPAIGQLRGQLASVLRQANLEGVEEVGALRFSLLQYTGLSPQVFESAVRFAEGVVNGLELASDVGLSELAFFRYESTAAGEDWDNGAWASDLNWQIINVYPLTETRSR